MRSGPNTRRMRGRSNGARRGGAPRSHNFDSNGPGIKVRGNAQQIVDKYQTLAREATIAGDRVMAENYNQHAEHYHRILIAQAAENRPENKPENRPENRPDNQQDNRQDNQRDQSTELSGSDGSGDRPNNPPDTQTENRNGTRQEQGAGPADGEQPIEVRTAEENEAPAAEAPAAEAPEQSAAPAATDSEKTPKPRPRRTPRRRTTPRPAPVEGSGETTS